MEFALILNARQTRDLQRLLDRAAAELRVELNHTDARSFKEELLQRLDSIEEISRKLAQIEPTVAVLK